MSETTTITYLSNSLRSVVALVDGSGLACERYTFDAWGVTRDVVGKTGTSTAQPWSQVGNPWTFTGRQGDFEERSGLFCWRARAYIAVSGQFAQRDPIGPWGDFMSLGGSRVYCGGNPVNRLDPLGLAVIEPPEREGISNDDYRCFKDAYDYFKTLSFKLPFAARRSGMYMSYMNIWAALNVLPGEVHFIACKRLDVSSGADLAAISVANADPTMPVGSSDNLKEVKKLNGLADPIDHVGGVGRIWIRAESCCTREKKARMVKVLLHESIHVLANSNVHGSEIDDGDGASPFWDPLRNKEPKDGQKRTKGSEDYMEVVEQGQFGEDKVYHDAVKHFENDPSANGSEK